MKQEDKEIVPFEAEHGKYYYCIKDYFCGGRKQASKGDVVQALRGLPIMGLKDASKYFLPVNSIKCNSAWSEKDEIHQLHVISLIEDIKDWANKDGMHSLCIERCIESVDWLKDLKDRVQPKSQWNPSDEQMKALDIAIRCGIQLGTWEEDALKSLEEQLKNI